MVGLPSLHWEEAKKYDKLVQTDSATIPKEQKSLSDYLQIHFITSYATTKFREAAEMVEQTAASIYQPQSMDILANQQSMIQQISELCIEYIKNLA